MSIGLFVRLSLFFLIGHLLRSNGQFVLVNQGNGFFLLIRARVTRYLVDSDFDSVTV